MRRKRAHILWQPITARKSKLRKPIQNVEKQMRMDENQPSIKVRRKFPISGSGHNQVDNYDTASNMIAVTPSSEGVNFKQTQPIPYDNSLLERARMQWQFGEWKSLTELDYASMQHHPDRAMLALLVAAGYQQTGDVVQVRKFVRLAQEWGISNKLLNQVLISGIYNSLGRVAILAGQRQRAIRQIESAVGIGLPHADIKLLSKVRMDCQLVGLGERIGLRGSNEKEWFGLNESTPPRLIVINGMARSGSTVAMNIVTDLLEAANVPYMKYYIRDFDNYQKFTDHVIQNPALCCVLKTHEVTDDLLYLSGVVKTRYVYTYRNILEAAASFVRMTKVKESPTYRADPVTLSVVKGFIRVQLKEMRRAETLDCLLKVNCDELAVDDISKAVASIAGHIGIIVSPDILKWVAQKRMRSNSYEYSRAIGVSELTSLGHERTTFFHKDHVVDGGTNVRDELPDEWVRSIVDEFRIDADAWEC